MSQTGTNSAAFVDQYGSGNQSTFNQEGDYNQEGATSTLPTIDPVSGNPIAHNDGSNMAGATGVHQYGYNLISGIDQIGTHGTVSVVQINYSTSTRGFTFPVQTGNDRSVVTQGGDSNLVVVTQTGSLNDSSIDQADFGGSNDKIYLT